VQLVPARPRRCSARRPRARGAAARCGDARRDDLAALAGRRAGELGGGDRLHLDDDVHAVEQRAR
jgi:hypothetical protein